MNAVIHHKKTNIAGVSNLPPDAQRAMDDLRLIGGDELVREMAATFSKFATAQVERLGEASDAGNLDQVASFAQALHASARQMGAMRLAEAAVSAEVAARGQDAGGVASAIADAHRALSDARAWLGALAAP
jgi:HPt (histidine-containing phosphotransfer) domain-containing protein